MIGKISVLVIERQGRQDVPVNMTLQELNTNGIKLSDENVKSITVTGDKEDCLNFITDNVEQFAEMGFQPDSVAEVSSDISGEMKVFGVNISKKQVLTREAADALLADAFQLARQ